MRWFLRFFTWWHSATLNTLFYTWWRGELVGSDEFGNRYYRARGRRKDAALAFERRWVIYAGYAEGSMTPPGWYGWLHHTVDVAPPEENYAPRDWQAPYLPNLTGTPQAWRPPGSSLAAGTRPPATGDYDAWKPEG
jgi:NADH:ubiquinone oxidoreductase subunit